MASYTLYKQDSPRNVFVFSGDHDVSNAQPDYEIQFRGKTFKLVRKSLPQDIQILAGRFKGLFRRYAVIDGYSVVSVATPHMFSHNWTFMHVMDSFTWHSLDGLWSLQNAHGLEIARMGGDNTTMQLQIHGALVERFMATVALTAVIACHFY